MRFPGTLIMLFGLSLPVLDQAMAQPNFDLVMFPTTDGGRIEGAFYTAKSRKAVIFAHGAVFNKESWYFLCEELQAKDIAALSFDFRGCGNSKAGSTGNKSLDILGASTWLVGQGFTEIAIVGGSMGGAAVLEALPEINTEVSMVVLLAPGGGPAISSKKIDKLFIVSTEEGLYPRVLRLFKDSAEPKQLKEFAGRAHAQHMFKEAYAGELTQLIIDFLNR